VGSQEPQHHAGQQGRQVGGEADEEGQPGTVDQAGKQIPPQIVGTKGEDPVAALPEGRLQQVVAELLHRVVGG